MFFQHFAKLVFFSISECQFVENIFECAVVAFEFEDWGVVADGECEYGAAEKPILYVRGNHEMRGTYGDQFLDYFACGNGTSYES